MEDYKKKYEEALDNFKKIKAANKDNKELVNFIEYEYPELRESEDERIRKNLINFLDSVLHIGKDANFDGYSKVDCAEWIAWLKKPKYTDEDLDKAYKCADEVQYRRGYEDAKKEIEKQGKNNMGISEATKQKLEDNLNKALEKETPESWNEFIEKQGEQKPAWSEEDEKYNNIVVSALYNPSIEGLYNFHKINRSDVITWLKSLRPQPQWKPSDEQMKVLQWCLPLWAEPKSKAILKSLINDLKKFREE